MSELSFPLSISPSSWRLNRSYSFLKPASVRVFLGGMESSSVRWVNEVVSISCLSKSWTGLDLKRGPFLPPPIEGLFSLGFLHATFLKAEQEKRAVLCTELFCWNSFNIGLTKPKLLNERTNGGNITKLSKLGDWKEWYYSLSFFKLFSFLFFGFTAQWWIYTKQRDWTREIEFHSRRHW